MKCARRQLGNKTQRNKATTTRMRRFISDFKWLTQAKLNPAPLHMSDSSISQSESLQSNPTRCVFTYTHTHSVSSVQHHSAQTKMNIHSVTYQPPPSTPKKRNNQPSNKSESKIQQQLLTLLTWRALKVSEVSQL